MKKLLSLLALTSLMYAEPIDELISSLEKEVLQEDQSFKGFSKTRGEKVFTTAHKGKKGDIISCASCHTNDFTKKGKHHFTGEELPALARSVNPKAFTDVRHVNKWLRRNFKDVYNRLGTPKEKGDVLVYMLSKAR